MNIFAEKLKDMLFAVLPVTLIVLLLAFTIVPMSAQQVIFFIIGAVLIMFGLALFLVGVDIGITPFGSLIGTTIAKKNKLWIVIVSGFILGFFISVAEPGLLVLANQVDVITQGGIPSTTLLIVVSLGIALMMVLGFLRVLFNWPLRIVLNLSYLIVFAFAIFMPGEIIAIAFDASGATTGVLAVPFILSLSLGITSIKKDSKASEKDSFGLVAITSVGAIIFVMFLSIFSKDLSLSGSLAVETSSSSSVISLLITLLQSALRESSIALFPLVTIFLILNFTVFSLTKKQTKSMLFGFIYAFLGLNLFFIGVNGGFMEVGTHIGSTLATRTNSVALIVVGFVFGVVTILAEPAVYVLTHQIEEVTSGHIKRSYVLFALSCGVGLAIALSMLRIVIPPLQLWHFLLPGYLICLILSFIVPNLFVGIAFDAGGVATGPMTATFILAFTHGAANAYVGADLLVDGFGMISMVALMPIITLQILGFIFKVKSQKVGV